MQIIDVGETVPIVTGWFDVEQAAAEPTDITVTATAPDGTVTTFTKADGTGTATTEQDPPVLDVWTFLLVVDVEGAWRVKAVGEVGADTVTQSQVLLVGAASRAGGPFDDWCDWDDVQAQTDVDLSSIEPGVRDQLISVASWIMWSLDGRRYPGVGQATRRVCQTCTRCRVPSGCCCAAGDTLDLGSRWPVWGVWDVTIDGEVLDPAAYQLRDRRFVDRIDGALWPRCASLADADAFVLTWAFGRPIPIGLRNGCAAFVAELAKGKIGLDCEIPQRVVSVVREHVAYVVLDSQKFLDQGRTGVYAADLALIAAAAGRKIAPGMSNPFPATRVSRV